MLEPVILKNLDVSLVQKILAPIEISIHEYDNILVDHEDLLILGNPGCARQVRGVMDTDLKELYSDLQSGPLEYLRTWSPHRFNLPTILEVVDRRTGEIKFYKYL